MKNRLEEYVRAIINAEQTKMVKSISLVAMVVIIISVFFAMLIAVSSEPVILGSSIIIAVSILALILHNKYSKEQKIAEQKRDLLHPTDGEEGALFVAKKKINEIFTGTLDEIIKSVRTKDDLDERDSN